MRPPVIHFSSKCYHANIRLIASLFLALASISACAKTIFPLQIVRTPQVAQQISTASPVERKQIEEAIRVGNKFINARFSFADYPDHPDSWSDWERDIGPLMAMGVEAWATVWEKEGWEIEAPMNSTLGYGTLLSCPTAQLIDINMTPRGIRLGYRSILIGMATTGGRPKAIETKHQEQPYLLEIDINRNDRITAVHTPVKIVARVYQSKIKYEQSEIDRWRNEEGGGRAKKKVELEGVEKFIKSIKEAASICADISKASALKGE